MTHRGGGRVAIKICGVTRAEDAVVCVDAGADAIGVNLIPTSARFVTREEARAVQRAVAGRIPVVAVVADPSIDALRELGLAFDGVQLHGDEPPELVASLLPRAYKAVRIATAEDVAAADAYPGERLLADARVQGMLGGTGRTFDWSLVRELAARRQLWLAGGLTQDNVGAAIATARPFAVDVASGVEREGEPRRKDARRVLDFIAAVRAAEARLR